MNPLSLSRSLRAASRSHADGLAWLMVLSVMGLSIGSIGCQSPMDRTAEQELHDHLMAAHRAHVQNAAAGPVVELTRPKSEVDNELSDERRAELDRIAGPNSYQGHVPQIGSDLSGKTDANTVRLTLQKAIQLAVQGNIDVQTAQLLPAINQSQVTQAEAAFDAVLFSSLTVNNLDQPQPNSPTYGTEVKTQSESLTTGIRKPLETGATASVSTTFARNYSLPNGNNDINQYYTSNVELTLKQPLLKGFGTDVNRSQIVLAKSAKKQAVQEARKNLMDAVLQTEQAYWNLYMARQKLMIQERLLQRTIDDYKRIKQREDFDVNPVRKTEAGSFVEIRRSDVIRVRQEVRIASDQLKKLLNSQEIPLSGEILIEPLDAPADSPVSFALLDAVTQALANRPESQQALLKIKDSSVRLMVADNNRLPDLSLTGTMRFNGLGSSIGSAYGDVGQANYMDYILGGQFEMPIGNRGPDALYEQRTLERRQATLGYQKAAQEVVQQVKDSMRQLLTSYELIGAARAARRAAADNLRAIERQEEAGVALTPEFLLDLKLNSQQRLANAEADEMQSLTDYNTAIATYYRAVGTLLQRNQIEFKVEADGD